MHDLHTRHQHCKRDASLPYRTVSFEKTGITRRVSPLNLEDQTGEMAVGFPINLIAATERGFEDTNNLETPRARGISIKPELTF